MSELRRFLVRASLDPEFREHVRANLDEALSGFELSEDEREALARGGRPMMRLVSEASLEGASRIIPAPPAPRSPEPAAPAAAPEVEMTFLLRLLPFTVRSPDGALAVGYQAAVSASGEAATDTGTQAGPSQSPWSDRRERPAVLDAAAAVREAPPAERRARLLDLVDALTRD